MQVIDKLLLPKIKQSAASGVVARSAHFTMI